MKYIIIADFLYPAVVGGSARYAYDLACGLEDLGYDFVIITRVKSGVYSSDINDIHYEKWLASGKIFEISGIESFICSLKLFKSNCKVISHHPILTFLYTFFIKKKKHFYFFHGPFHEEFKAKSSSVVGFYIRKLIQKFVMVRTKKTFVISEFMEVKAKALSSYSVIKKINPIVQVEKFRSDVLKKNLRTKYEISTHKKVLITSRRLTNRTGVIELVECFLSHFSATDYQLIVIGNGELSDNLNVIIKNQPSVQFFSNVSDEMLRDYLNLSDVYVLPSKELEGFGLVILEALSAGLPVVATVQSGGGADFISKFHASLLFDFSNMQNTLYKSIDYALNLDESDNIFKSVDSFGYVSVTSRIVDELHVK